MARIGILLVVLMGLLACSHVTKCVVVDADCCGCRRGGKQKAIDVRDFDAWKKQRDTDCSHKVCMQIISRDPSCNMSNAKYENGMCVLNGTDTNTQ